MKMTRSELLKELSDVSDMSHHELSLNTQWIKDLTTEAHAHIVALQKAHTKLKGDVLNGNTTKGNS
jgi:hypothetical protein